MIIAKLQVFGLKNIRISKVSIISAEEEVVVKRICVFLGSVVGNDAIYSEAAKEVGKLIAKRGHILVYGGSKIGLMGVLADAVLSHGGIVEGFAAEEFEKVFHPGLSTFQVFRSMAERKAALIEISDAFIVFPGGLGTLDELLEVWTMKKANVLHKPLGILNINHLFTPLYTAIKTLVQAGFITEEQYQMVSISTDPQQLLEDLLFQCSEYVEV